MSVRPPDVAGSFYPADPERLGKMVREFLPKAEAKTALAVLVPHAGYVYSGMVAGAVFARVKMPRDVILLCFSHRGWGKPIAVWPSGEWKTPLGRVEVSAELTDAIVETCGAERDEAAHEGEHSGEVQVPFLQTIRPDVRLAPVSLQIGFESFEKLKEFGRNLSKVPGDFLVAASTDLNHFDPHEETIEKDRHVIDAIASLDEDAMRRAVLEKNVSMCGTGPTTAMIAYARARGAAEAELIEHRTSFDSGGDASRTVGYAGMVVYPPK